MNGAYAQPLTAPPAFAGRQSRGDSKKCHRPALLFRKGNFHDRPDSLSRIYPAQVQRLLQDCYPLCRLGQDFEAYPMRFRICRFQLDNGEFETVATSLPRSFRLEDIKALYHLRWGLEVGFRDLKYTLGLVNLHGKSDEFAEQEIYAGLTAFNFASRVCQEVVVRQPKDGVYAYKVNFKMAVALCKDPNTQSGC